MMKYIGMGAFVSNNCIDIKEMEFFENFAKENNINTVFKNTLKRKTPPVT